MRWRGVVLVAVMALVVTGCGGDGSDDRAQAAAALTEARIDGLVSTMEVMATTTEARSGDWEAMAGMLTEFQEQSIPLVAWFVQPDGSYFTVTAGAASANLSDRAYFAPVMAGDVVVGELVVSRSTGRKSMVAVVPIDGGSVGALGMSLFLDELTQTIVDDLGLDSDATFHAVTEEGVVVLHPDSELITEPGEDLGGGGTATAPTLGWIFTVG